MREYRTGTRWCAWRWKHIDYLTRLHVVQTPFGSICVHFMKRADSDRDMHDHPVSFLSVVLRGGYVEARHNNHFRGLIRRRWFNWIPASFLDKHRIVSVQPGTVTLCFMGPKRREWGFHTARGWVYWRDYNAA